MRNSLVLIGILQFTILVFGLVHAKGLSLMLGPSGIGIVGTIDQLIVTLTHFGAFGLPYTAMKFMSSAHSKSEDEFHRTFAAFMRVILTLSILTTVICLVILYSYPDVFGQNMARYRDALWFAFMGTIPFMLTAILVHTFAASQRPLSGGIFNAVSVACLAIASIIGAALAGLPGLYAFSTAAGFLIVGLTFVYLRAQSGLSIFTAGISLRQEITKNPNLFYTALSVYLTLVAYALCLLFMRYAVLGHIGEVETGLLQAALALSLSVGSILAAMANLSLAPTLNRDVPEAEKIRTAHDFTGKILLILFAGALPVALFPGLVISILYTNEFKPAATTFVLCLIWQGLYQVMNAYQQLLIGLNQMRYMAFSAVTGFVLSGVLVFAGVKVLGIFAVPVALMAGTLVTTALILGRLIRHNNLVLPRQLVFRILYVAAVLLSAGFLFNPGQELTLNGILVRFAFAAAAVALTWRLLDNQERDLVYKGLSHLRGFLKARGLPPR